MTSFTGVLDGLCAQVEQDEALQTFCKEKLGTEIRVRAIFADPDGHIERLVPMILVTRAGMSPTSASRPEGSHEVNLNCCFKGGDFGIRDDAARVQIGLEERVVDAVMKDPGLGGLALGTVFLGTEACQGEFWPYLFTTIKFSINHRRSCSYV